MTFVHEFDQDGNHRLVLCDEDGSRKEGKMVSYRAPAYLQDKGATFVAYTQYADDKTIDSKIVYRLNVVADAVEQEIV
jgi:hypothetical protein